MNEKMKLKRKTKTAKNVICAKDDGTKYRPRHDINTRTCYMC